jgi:hypothetical protein
MIIEYHQKLLWQILGHLLQRDTLIWHDDEHFNWEIVLRISAVVFVSLLRVMWNDDTKLRIPKVVKLQKKWDRKRNTGFDSLGSGESIRPMTSFAHCVELYIGTIQFYKLT